MNTLLVWVPGPIPDPIAYNAGFKRLLKAGQQTVPNDLDFRRLLKKGAIEPMCALSAQFAGRPIFKLPKKEAPAEQPSGRKDN